jgi:hypothetical protein
MLCVDSSLFSLKSFVTNNILLKCTLMYKMPIFLSFELYTLVLDNEGVVHKITHIGLKNNYTSELSHLVYGYITWSTITFLNIVKLNSTHICFCKFISVGRNIWLYIYVRVGV